MLVYLLVWFKKDQPFFEFFNLFAFLFGLISIVALFVGFLTSNKYFMRLLGSNWKKIQMIAYPALLAATIHVYLINETR
jgi:DMSO/TMAO reductase YedYZ heme-binding membrane subunit